jgi:two-component system, response regulator / RNA-binding antiterminator
MLKVMIVDDGLPVSKSLKQSLMDSGFAVLAQMTIGTGLAHKLNQFEPDVVIMDIQSVSEQALMNVGEMDAHFKCPIVMFTQDMDKQKIKAATQAGVSAYVVGTIPKERLAPVIDAAIARFEEIRYLRNELNLANAKLDERKVIERAKGLLMKQRNLDEDASYSLLRSMAMQRNMKLADLSNQLIEAAKMLII